MSRFFERCFGVAAFGVNSVAVGGFHDQVVGAGDDRRLFDDRLLRATDVAAEDQPSRLFFWIVGVQVDFDTCGAEHMPGGV